MTVQVQLGEPLTAAQAAEIERVGDEWHAVGMSTQRCDRAKAEDAVRAAYRAAGIDEPQLVIWMDGSTAYLGHPEHGFMGIGAGTYEIRRQREMAEELRMVAD